MDRVDPSTGKVTTTRFTGLIAAGYGSLWAASANDQKNDADKPALAGVWAQKGGELTLEFSDPGVMRISPHGDNRSVPSGSSQRADVPGTRRFSQT